MHTSTVFEAPEGKALPFIEADTWMEIYNSVAPMCFVILNNAVVRSRNPNDEQPIAPLNSAIQNDLS